MNTEAKTLSPEQRDFLKNNIEAAAKENGVTVIEQISAMQSVAAKRGQETALEILIELKKDYYNL